ncbi:glucan endo-1,3-beta-glucosidase A1-like protein [Metarhizium album ARSEF 1941]|uniref:Glucan endo-1,3-beta-glucosidase A1-like protein n=1 Tax=Metarhizium album (strain ARSEF 1941) TaxID=1081103 RepID=A0A0B2WVF2_METAS|nr:glucan endo-1,3-beta-glucosidase A1-like protein [Metarhizium album ARSEF 1941]KHN98053.1 glucan endo-1,3-beta-glucosidase A1-like protein [Metarhizium album ARSEF 1941]
MSGRVAAAAAAAAAALFAAHGIMPCAAKAPHANAVKTAQMPAGFSNRIFYDDFSGPEGSLPDASRWTIDQGTQYDGGPEHWGTREVESYTADWQNIHITADGTLKITPVRGDGDSWTSARIETTADWDFACACGERLRVEASIKLGDNAEDRSLGIWPAFWALGAAYRGNYQNWPALGEVDILETVNGLRKIWSVVHCGTSPGGVCNEPNGISHTTEPFERGVWHSMAWEIDRSGSGPESMTWYVDGRPQWTLWEQDVGDADAWHALAADPKMLLLNVAVGGGFPDGVSGLKTPTDETLGGDGASMEVDYVAVYSEGGW